MKHILLGCVALVLPTMAHANELTLQLKWLPSAQFAGYYLAEELGYYEAEGLDVSILPGGPGIIPTQQLASNRADIIIEWMPAALAAREKGLPLINIAQPFEKSSLRLICLKASDITEPTTDFAGKSFGVWFGGNEYPFLNWMSKLGLSSDEFTLQPQKSGLALLSQQLAACVHVMGYNQFWQLDDAGLHEKQVNVFRYHDHSAATLEDGIYTLEKTLKNHADDLEKFTRASMEGWKYARENPRQAAEIILKYDVIGPQDVAAQTRIVKDVVKLIDPEGTLEPSDYQRTVETLLSGDSYQVISTAPNGAWTRIVTDRILRSKNNADLEKGADLPPSP